MARSKLHWGVACCSLKEVAESELVAESRLACDIGHTSVRGRQQCSGFFEPPTFEMLGKWFAHRGLKQVGTILFRISEKSRQQFERQALVEVGPYKCADACRERGVPDGFRARHSQGMAEIQQGGDDVQ